MRMHEKTIAGDAGGVARGGKCRRVLCDGDGVSQWSLPWLVSSYLVVALKLPLAKNECVGGERLLTW